MNKKHFIYTVHTYIVKHDIAKRRIKQCLANRNKKQQQFNSLHLLPFTLEHKDSTNQAKRTFQLQTTADTSTTLSRDCVLWRS